MMLNGEYEPFDDDDVALECLLSGGGDVAFISMDTVQKYKGTLLKFCFSSMSVEFLNL